VVVGGTRSSPPNSSSSQAKRGGKLTITRKGDRMKDAFYFVADLGDGASRPPRWHTICKQTKLIAVDLTGVFISFGAEPSANEMDGTA
jgi:hypothetical protein